MAEWVLLPTELDCAEANRHGNDNGGQGGLGTGVPVLVLLGGRLRLSPIGCLLPLENRTPRRQRCTHGDDSRNQTGNGGNARAE